MGKSCNRCSILKLRLASRVVLLCIVTIISLVRGNVFTVDCVEGAPHQMAEVRAENDVVSLRCDGTEFASENISSEEMIITINSKDVEETTINRLDAPKLSNLLFRRSEESKNNKSSIIVFEDTFTELVNLRVLSFESINFLNPCLKLSLPSSITEINISGTELLDLDVLTTQAPQWTKINLQITFPSIPTFLRRLKMDTNVHIEGLKFKCGATTVLPEQQYLIVKELFASMNLVTNAVFRSKCGDVSNSLRNRNLKLLSTTSPPPMTNMEDQNDTSSELHVVCFDNGPKAASALYGDASVRTEDAANRGNRASLQWVLVIIIVASCLFGIGLATLIVRLSVLHANVPRRFHKTRRTPRAQLLRKAASQIFSNAGDSIHSLVLDINDVSLNEGSGFQKVRFGDYEGRQIVGKRYKHDTMSRRALFQHVEHLTLLKHENIVSLIGITWPSGKDLTIITEYMEKGTLSTLLLDPNYDLDPVAKINLCLDIATALGFLHTNLNMFIRQFTSRAVLVNDSKTCKISLFHCTPIDETTNSKMETVSFGTGEIAWCAPESLVAGHEVDPRSANIYSFGVIMGEIWTRNTPYMSLMNNIGYTLGDLDLYDRAQRNETLVPHENHSSVLQAPHGLRDLISLCLSDIPGMRPTAEDLIVALRVIKCHL